MSFNILQRLEHELNECTRNHASRLRQVMTFHDDTHMLIQGRSMLHFASNDYLCLSTHPDVKKAFQKGANQYGLGTGSSPLISGHTKAHAAAEEAFAAFLNRDKTILFNSGYHANLCILQTFANRHSTIIMDKNNHASLQDGAILSRASLYRYRDESQLSRLLSKHSKNETLLLTESVFSMQGNLANLIELSHLANQHDAMMIVDDAHGIGILGEKGEGALNHFGLTQADVPCLVSPLGKALGSFGAVVSGDRTLMDALLQFGRTYRYSTALPAAICMGTLKALTILQDESWRRDRLNQLIQFFTSEALLRQLPLFSIDPTPIKSIIIGTNQAALSLQQYLLTQNIFVSCIRPPTVPKHQACIRISLNCMHKEEDILLLLNHIDEVYER